MASVNVGFEILKNSRPRNEAACILYKPDRMMPVSTMHRLALKATEKIILLMNNTQMLTRHHRLASMTDVLVYLTGNHEDHGLPGDRGDFYKRKLAEQLFIHYGIHNVDHTNVMALIEGIINLENYCRCILSQSGCVRSEAPPVSVDDQVLDIVSRLGDMN